MVIGLPSPAFASPLLVSRSTGPQPFVAVRNGSELTATCPAGGAGGTAPTIRSSAADPGRPACRYATATFSAEVSTVEGAVTGQVKVAARPPSTFATEGGDAGPTVHPAGAVSAGSTSNAGAAPAATRTVAEAVNRWPPDAVSGVVSDTVVVGAAGIAYRAGS